MVAERDHEEGYAFYDPNTLWQTVASVIAEVIREIEHPHIAAIGIASMAETGALIERTSGIARSPFLPWFDTAAASSQQVIEQQGPESDRFRVFGIYPSFKCSLAKILWWKKQSQETLDGAIWLSVADYVAYRLTGALATDYSLAGRTYAFDLERSVWAHNWLAQLGIPVDLFPSAAPATTICGTTTSEAYALGLGLGIPVAIAGHDHVCASFAAGVAAEARVFDSMGTAEVLTGAFSARPLGAADFDSGLSFGIMPNGRDMYWLGGLSSSGGALEWLRDILGEPPLSYEALRQLQERVDEQPGEIFFMPYLAGSGAPRPNPAVRGAFLGLKASHSRAEMVKAVLEGTAFQIEAIRRAATRVVGTEINHILAAGGGTRNVRWLQIKADIHGTRVDALTMDEATLLGAALIAGIGCGVYASEAEARAIALAQQVSTFTPHMERHMTYAQRFVEFWAWHELLHQRR
jgi:xylulokinase